MNFDELDVLFSFILSEHHPANDFNLCGIFITYIDLHVASS